MGGEEDEQEKEPFNVSEAQREGSQGRRGRPHTFHPTGGLGLALVVVPDSAFTSFMTEWRISKSRGFQLFPKF